jgi:hypothetical protein
LRLNSFAAVLEIVGSVFALNENQRRGYEGQLMFIKRHALFDAVALVGLVLASFVGVAHSEETLSTPPAGAIIKMPLDQLDPPRGVAAKDWKSAFCARWDDGCTHCTQSARDAPVTCAANEQAGMCKRHAVICFREMDHDYFLRACKFSADERYWKTKDGRIFAEAATRRVDWISDVNGVFPISKGLNETSDPHTFLLLADTFFFFLPPQGYKRWDGHEGLPLNSPAFGPDVRGIRCEETYK